MHFFFFFFNRHYNPLLSFGLLNCRWAFSAGRFLQSAVASSTSNPQLGGPVIRTFQLSPQGSASVSNDTSEGGTMGEKWPRILPKVATSTSLFSSFTCRNFTTWDRRLYFSSEGRHTGFFRPKNPTASARFEPGNLGTKGDHATSRSPKPLDLILETEVLCCA